ncbi:hypothetical protein J3Q64DRAFT_1751634 [Phycomyces blakesleeanus]|uniref:Uncharacterized protein n=1 Tax=Phycomyces blakesleeanus TaxID=4837 RepID=A0ABR3AUN5_PHYBL
MKELSKHKREKVEGVIHKRTPQRPAADPTHIYLSHKSKTIAIVKRIKRLMINERNNKVTLHALGATIKNCLSVALAVQEAMNHQVDLKPTTESVVLVDDVVPEDMVSYIFPRSV